MPHPIQPGGGGGGGVPALPFTSVQFNNAGAFGGSPNFTWNGTGVVVTNGAGTTDTLSPGTLLFTTAGTGTVSVKTGGGADGPLNLDILDLQINGASGVAGQALISGGAGAPPTWGALAAAGGWTDGGTTVYLSTATDVVSIGNNAAVTNRKLSVYNTGTDLGASVVTLAASDNVLATNVSGEAQNRYAVDGGGSTVWGAGGASAPDARLRRTTTSTLQLDDNAGGSATLIVLGQTKTQQRAVAVTTRNAAYNVQSNDDVVLCDPIVPFDVTLPSAALVIGRRVTIKRISTSANVITVKSAGGTIDLVAAGTGIALPGGTLNSITVVADGINWWII